MISFSPFADMFLIRCYEIFLECQLCCVELGREGQNVQRQGEWHVGRAWQHQGHRQAAFPSFQQGLRMFWPTLASARDMSGNRYSGRFGERGPQRGHDRRPRAESHEANCMRPEELGWGPGACGRAVTDAIS